MWQRMGGAEILPPVYEKKVGRPPKNRRKQPHEVEGKFGPKMSKHGTVITCGFCGEEGHNRGGCGKRKSGSIPIVPPQEQEQEEQMISQVSMDFEQGSQPMLSQLSNTMLSCLDAEVTSVPTVKLEHMVEPSLYY
jgi:hypothetical protein